MTSSAKRILVVGAGAAGMSCAHQLAQHPDKFDVTLIDAVDYCGGQAFSIPIDAEKHGASWLNQGVQGGSHIFRHTMHMFRKQGHDVSPVNLQVSFGKGDNFWTNVFPTSLVAEHQKDIARFSTALKWVRRTELVWALVPIKIFARIWGFSEDFVNAMLLPSIALFLGTGNATPDVPTIVLERIFTSPTYGMWFPPDERSLASNEPPMVVFPEFSAFYGDWKKDLERRGVHVRLETELLEVVQRDKNTSSDVVIEEYDELVLCVLADTAKRILGKKARWIEGRVLGKAKFADDITVTHCDTQYMEKWYTNGFDEERAVDALGDRDESERVEKGRREFKPMYYIKQTPADPKKLEMCFDCSNYQAQFSRDLPFEQHVFQTIFLNKNDRETWSYDEIDRSKIIREDWWHQLCHSWTHYAFVVPWMWLLNGKKSVTYAGSWTMVNAHEIAVLSGIAAAHRLGADYPLELEQEEDGFALLYFKMYYLLSHGRWYGGRKGVKKHAGDGTGTYTAAGVDGSEDAQATDGVGSVSTGGTKKSAAARGQ
ncbi:hypothetical protein BD626DRAFT_551463 [Schizophyllum amplum]|uniref:FAD/NAD(P)-binding domain-containing protein n=1 Tax=Schizophyllum amplum TaxID=97359 RepID=A0A550BVT2_9AGAR|nr:hypothetical protein BD626DRAFT_551463 [Auriculariopsis ampla]